MVSARCSVCGAPASQGDLCAQHYEESLKDKGPYRGHPERQEE